MDAFSWTLVIVAGGSLLALGYAAMKTRWIFRQPANTRTTHAAQGGLIPALKVAFTGGSVMDLCGNRTDAYDGDVKTYSPGFWSTHHRSRP